MNFNAEEVLLPSEVDIFTETIQPSNLQDLGSQKWLIFHGQFHKIHQQAVIEASQLKEEIVKDKLILHEKIPVIVHELICSALWRKHVLPELVVIHPDPKDTFILYAILYHEATAVALLETVLYHSESCDALGDSVTDLIDYCVEAVTHCISREIDQKIMATENMTSGQLLKLEETRLRFDTGIRSISILRCLAEYLDSLTLGAARRLYEFHDLPLLFVELINNPPWISKDSSDNSKIYKDGKWHDMTQNDASGQIFKAEGQVWIGLLFLLLGPKCQMHYEITESRKNRLLKLQRHLHEELLDQLAPLVDLKQWLSHLSVSSPPVTTKPMIFEEIPEIKERLLKRYSKKWKKVAKHQAEVLFHSVKGDMQEIAKSLGGAYDLSALASLLQEDAMCANGCNSRGTKRCSQCKVEWYCGRECQVQHWHKHKATCKPSSISNKDNP